MRACLLLSVLVLAGAVDAADDALPATVARLVRQLDARELAQREAAETQLIQLGPDVLDHLPRHTARLPAEVRQRLARIQQRLHVLAAEASTRAALVTYRGDHVPASQVLEAIRAQTGNKIVDMRVRLRQEPNDPQVTVDFQNTPFWQALDQTLDRAGLSVYAYGEREAVNVVARPPQERARGEGAIYCGPFRLEATNVLAQRDLRLEGSHALRLTVEVAWEPRLRPIFFRQRLADVDAYDERGHPIGVENPQAEVELSIKPGMNVSELLVPLAPPMQDSRRIGRLQGKMEVLLPGRQETFRFEQPTQAENQAQRIAGATVVLEGVQANHDAWEVRMFVRYDDAGKALESHRGWIYQNPAYLEEPDGKRIDFGSRETTRQTENEFGAAYVFPLDKPPTNVAFVYQTPALIRSFTFDYEIKDVHLP